MLEAGRRYVPVRVASSGWIMRRTSLPAVAVSLWVLLAAGCAGGAPVTGGPRTDPAVITRDQVMDVRFATAYDAVRSLRSNWIHSRGMESFKYPAQIQVYVDGVRMGGLAALQNVSASSVQYIRYISGIDASVRWGLDHGRGVIWVSTGDDRPDIPAPATRPYPDAAGEQPSR